MLIGQQIIVDVIGMVKFLTKQQEKSVKDLEYQYFRDGKRKRNQGRNLKRLCCRGKKNMFCFKVELSSPLFNVLPSFLSPH